MDDRSECVGFNCYNLHVTKTGVAPVGPASLICWVENSSLQVAAHPASEELGNKGPLSLRREREISLVLCPVIGNSETAQPVSPEGWDFLSKYTIW